jgi:DNA modification methylase
MDTENKNTNSVRIDCEDCLTWLPKLKGPVFQLAFADPPFSIGQPYEGFYDGSSTREQYEFTKKWAVNLWSKVAYGGVMALYHPVAMQGAIWSFIEHYGLAKHHEQTLIAHYSFGQHQDTDFINAHCQCVILRKPGDRKFNPDSILIESERLKSGDKRCLKSKRKGMRVPGNVLTSHRIVGNHRERWIKKNGALVDHPNQLPLSFLKTLVNAYTDPGDRVIEPFTGTGGLALVCDRENRQYSGCELVEKTAESARKRVTHGYYS